MEGCVIPTGKTCRYPLQGLLLDLLTMPLVLDQSVGHADIGMTHRNDKTQ